MQWSATILSLSDGFNIVVDMKAGCDWQAITDKCLAVYGAGRCEYTGRKK